MTSGLADYNDVQQGVRAWCHCAADCQVLLQHLPGEQECDQPDNG